MNEESKKIRSFTDLDTWKEGHVLVLMIYKITKDFPREESFGLISQLRRAGVSFTSNIAEGFSRKSYKDKAHFYSISLGSLTEVENQIIIAKDIDYIDLETFNKLILQIYELHKMTNGLIKASKNFHIVS